MQKFFIFSTAFIVSMVLSASVALSHCEVPCGIYNDEARLNEIDEHVATIEKAMGQIELLGKDGKNYNQIVRWVITKEDHAEKLQYIVTQYFMTQRLKPGKEGTQEQLKVLHKMLVAAMKAKQTTDTVYTKELHQLNHEFRKLYMK